MSGYEWLVPRIAANSSIIDAGEYTQAGWWKMMSAV